MSETQIHFGARDKLSDLNLRQSDRRLMMFNNCPTGRRDEQVATRAIQESRAMLTIQGRAHRGFCDGVTRRDFVRIGGLALGGLSLPQVLAAEASAGTVISHKAVIMIFLAGGPPHQDMVDLKPDAP